MISNLERAKEPQSTADLSVNMLRLNTFRYRYRPISPLRSLFFFSSSSLSFPRRSLPAIKTALSPATIIEHFVLFSVKPTTPSNKIESMLSNLRSLGSLPNVTHLTAFPVHRHRTFASEPFSHVLHSRYRTKSDLAAYSANPSHLSVVKDSVLPSCADILAVDWVAGTASSELEPGSAARLVLVKAKEGVGSSGKGEILEALMGLKEDYKSGGNRVKEVSFGENFSPERSKGYEVGLLAVVGGVEEVDVLDKLGVKLEKQTEKIGQLIDGVIALDFVVPTRSSL